MITAVVPCVNPDPSLLRVTVKSALDSGVNEVLVVDGGSLPVVLYRSRTRVLRTAEPMSIDEAATVGIAESANDWIVRLDVGDALLPAKLRQLSATVAAGSLCSVSHYANDAGDTVDQFSDGAPGASVVFNRTADSVGTVAIYPEVTCVVTSRHHFADATIQPPCAVSMDGAAADDGRNRDAAATGERD